MSEIAFAHTLQMFGVLWFFSAETVSSFFSATILGIVASLFANFLFTTRRDASKVETTLEEQRSNIEQKSSADPASPKLAWDLARVTLEQYFNRNLRQVTQIFITSIGVMLAGFFLIIYGSVVAIHQPAAENVASKLTILSGIITEFISATFMLIYRSTLKQANTYMAILEKINVVGMAVQIIETIPQSDTQSTETRTELAKMLMESLKTPPPNS